MANAITLFKKYTDLLDEVYQYASVSSVLDGDNRLVRMGANTNEIVIPKMSMDGLADYSRASGYVAGDVTLTNETVTFNYDRGRSFTVDAMDNEETAGVAFGQLSAEFIRTKAAPEIDAFRFATYAGISGISSAAAAAITTGDAVCEDIVGILDGEKLGTDAQRDIIQVDFTKTKGSGGFEAIKRTVSVIGDTEGDSTDAYTYSGTFRTSGSPITGTATISTPAGGNSKDVLTITFEEDAEDSDQ